MKTKYLPILAILVIGLASAGCTEYSDATKCSSNGISSLQVYSSPRYLDNGIYKTPDLNIIDGSKDGNWYDWKMENNFYKFYANQTDIMVDYEGRIVKWKIGLSGFKDYVVDRNTINWTLDNGAINATFSIKLEALKVRKLITIYNVTPGFVSGLGSTFRYQEDFTVINGNVDPDGKTLFNKALIIGNSKVWDSSNRTLESLPDSSNGKFTTQITKAWIQTAKFPIFIDPDVTLNLTVNMTDSAQYDGISGGTEIRGMVKWNVAAIPAGTNIIGAVFCPRKSDFTTPRSYYQVEAFAGGNGTGVGDWDESMDWNGGWTFANATNYTYNFGSGSTFFCTNVTEQFKYGYQNAYPYVTLYFYGPWATNSTPTRRLPDLPSIPYAGTVLATIGEIRFLSEDSAQSPEGYMNITYLDPLAVPNIALRNPNNITYGITNNISLTYVYSVIGGTIDKCWYRLDSNSNVTITGCTNTTFTAAQGSHNLTLFANSTAGGFAFTNTTNFTVDLAVPKVSLVSPTNTTLSNPVTLTFNFNDSFGDVQTCVRELNTVNTTISCANGTFSGISGHNVLRLYVIDAGNNSNFSKVEFEVDNTPPFLVRTAPANTTYTTPTVPITFNVADANPPIACNYELNGVNTSLSNCDNSSITGLPSGPYRFKLYANDTGGSINVTAVNFTVKYTLLSITAANESSNTNISQFSISLRNLVSGQIISNSTTSGTIQYIDITQLPNGNYELQVSSTGYVLRYYYITINENISLSLVAYMLSSDIATGVSFSAVDVYNAAIHGATINVYRFINGSTVLVGAAMTDSSGSATVPVENAISYTVIGSYNNINVSKVFTSSSNQPITLIFGSTGTPSFIQWLAGQLGATCSKINSTRTVFCRMNDSSGVVNSYSLVVSQVFNNQTFVTVCNPSNTSVPYATLECHLPALNVTYSYRLYANVGSYSYLLVSDTWSFHNVPNYGLMGVIMAWILVTTCMFIFVPNRWGAIAGTLLGFVAVAASWAIGFINLGEGGFSVIIGLGCVSFIVVYIMWKVDP